MTYKEKLIEICKKYNINIEINTDCKSMKSCVYINRKEVLEDCVDDYFDIKKINFDNEWEDYWNKEYNNEKFIGFDIISRHVKYSLYNNYNGVVIYRGIPLDFIVKNIEISEQNEVATVKIDGIII